MYTYDEEKKRFFFTNDLEEYLLDYGVEIEHIKNMQSRVLEQGNLISVIESIPFDIIKL